jgi:alkylated DNA repair dioxygenase AlkB
MTDAQLPMKRARNGDLRHFFSAKKKARQNTNVDPFAEELGSQLNSTPVYLTNDSWYILAKGWMPSTPAAFQEEWSLHPEKRHPLKLFGRIVYEKRWSQSWGVSYSYSGATNVARPLHESNMVQLLLQKANELTTSLRGDDEEPYNGCLQNWYEPDDTIGLHADDERAMRQHYPIFSLSWGGTRRFLFRNKASKHKTELWLEDGDLLVMGGSCQETHQHEVPKRRVTMDPPTSDRINWTIRAFHDLKPQCS